MVLVHAFGGSNPSAPAKKNTHCGCSGCSFWLETGVVPPNDFCAAKDSGGSAERSEAKLACSFRKQAEEALADIPPPQPNENTVQLHGVFIWLAIGTRHFRPRSYLLQ